ncbi:MAG: LLM class flavin-dependent oxidoreductase [SAR324 cluster bacterium]|nr:LLM class flavin-dependent oxidoreductase [SAR324 cluster bacterium]MCZ6842704.1 LLM class flavin-dependent oxidoreductase [SAR324 cluster bacterium]
MKFGFSVPPVGPGERSDAENYKRVIEDCRLAHSLGYDAAWALEHHFTPYFPTPDPLLYLAHIAAQCPGLGLGTCVLVLPWYHPLRITEQIAMLNLLSEGELYLGLGRGSARYEYERLGVDMTETRERFRETVEIIKRGLQGKPFSYEGTYFKFPETQIRPHLRAPEDIHFYGAIGSPESAEIMADLGLSLIHTTNFPDHYTDRIIANWRERAASHGMDAEGMTFPIHCNPTIVADTDEEALELARVYYPHFIRVQMAHYETAADYWKDTPGYEIHSKMFANLQKLAQPGEPLDKALSLQLVGSPETVIRRIETLRDNLGIGHIITAHFLYEMDDDLRRRSLRIFAEQVIPHFSDKEAAA